MSVIEISLQHISNGQYWILVRMCFTVSSKMRTKATYKCTSLVRHPGSVVVLTTSCLVHWNAEVPPNYGFGQGCFTGQSSFWFSSGPILVCDASSWVLDVSTLTDKNFCLSECIHVKDANLRELELQFSFITKYTVLLTMANSEASISKLHILFRFYL